jgi:hypothetical protein
VSTTRGWWRIGWPADGLKKELTLLVGELTIITVDDIPAGGIELTDRPYAVSAIEITTKSSQLDVFPKHVDETHLG